jgi:hypothetical protein
MEIRILNRQELLLSSLAALHMPADSADHSSPEFIAAIVRLVASFLAPCSERTIVDNVSRCLRGLEDPESELGDRVVGVLEDLVGYGDLLELREDQETGTGALVLYLAPPSFVRRKSGIFFLVGMAPDRGTPLAESLFPRVRNTAHTRRLVPLDGEALEESLRGCGLMELPESLWMRTPRAVDLQTFLGQWNARLDKGVTSGEISGLEVLDSEKSPSFYKGRWDQPRRRTGRFVAKREQRYGAPLWTYVRLESGSPVRLLDLNGGEWRGSDLAWHLQMAIDKDRGTPQCYRVDLEQASAATAVLTFFSPLPSWATRRLDTIGDREIAQRGLIAYRLATAELAEEQRFLQSRLWLTPIIANSTTQQGAD